MDTPEKFREPGVAGQFYSRDKLILERELSMLLESSPLLNFPRKIRALIAPHAGYLYSGGVAARAYSQIKNADYKRVVIIAPSHEESFPYCSIYSGIGYKTPFGEIPLEKNLSKKLCDIDSNIRLNTKGHSSSEHSLEVQLPFLQWCLGKFKIIPIAMGKQDQQQIDGLSKALSEIVPTENTLLVASSDLSHNYSDQKARQLDQVAHDAISDFDETRLWKNIQSKNTEMCGYGPVIVVMKTAKSMGAKKIQVLLYRNSSDISGNRDRVVGYLSAVVY